MDMSKIAQTLDRLLDRKDHKSKTYYFTFGFKNLSKISSDEIANSQLYKEAENKLNKVLISEPIQIVENMSSYPYTIEETVFDQGFYNSIRIKIKNYEHSKIPTMKFINKFSYLKSQNKLVILI
jgi:hypothetical protein